MKKSAGWGDPHQNIHERSLNTCHPNCYAFSSTLMHRVSRKSAVSSACRNQNQPTDIYSPVDQYMTGHPTLAKPELVFFLGQSLCDFSPMERGHPGGTPRGGGGGGSLFSQPAHRSTKPSILDPSSIHTRSILDPTSIHTRSILDPSSIHPRSSLDPYSIHPRSILDPYNRSRAQNDQS